MFSFEREELGDEFERPMDTKGGRMMVALPILVSLRPKEKRMTKQICLPGWTKQQMGLSRTWCWTARTLWNGFFHQEMCQSFMTIIRSYSQCWDWTQLRFLTLQCCGFEFECEFQLCNAVVWIGFEFDCESEYGSWICLATLMQGSALFSGSISRTGRIALGSDRKPCTLIVYFFFWHQFCNLTLSLNVQTCPCLAPKVHCVWHLRTVQVTTSWSSSSTAWEIGLCKGIPCPSEVTI